MPTTLKKFSNFPFSIENAIYNVIINLIQNLKTRFLSKSRNSRYKRDATDVKTI